MTFAKANGMTPPHSNAYWQLEERSVNIGVEVFLPSESQDGHAGSDLPHRHHGVQGLAVPEVELPVQPPPLPLPLPGRQLVLHLHLLDPGGERHHQPGAVRGERHRGDVVVQGEPPGRQLKL